MSSQKGARRAIVAWALSGAVAAGVLAGCKVFFRAPVPMHSLTYADPRNDAKCLLVLMPGMDDSDRTFEDERFLSLVREKNLAVDVVAVDATLGYYLRGIVETRLQEDVIAKIRGKYSRMWIAGVSMGGLGALLYARSHAADVRGLLLLAPYLGDDDLIDEIRRAGGPLRWQPPPRAEIDEDNYQRQTWGWIADVVAQRTTGPEIVLGFGSDDKLAPSARVLASGLPPDHVLTGGGAHDWPTWRGLFSRFLGASSFAKECAR